MDSAFPVLGELAKRQILYAGHGAHIMAYPVADYKYLNVAAFVRDSGNWPDDQSHTVSARKEDILDSFSEFGPFVRDLVNLLPAELNRWGMFDMLDHPLSSFTSGRITLAGDAAHASTPHLGFGAGMGIEDATVLIAILEQAATALKKGDPNVSKAKTLTDAFETYDSARRERAQWLVRSSRRQGEVVKWLVPEIGKDWNKILMDMEERTQPLLCFDWEGMICQAVDEFTSRLHAC
jgi:salicylate hydroxylase